MKVMDGRVTTTGATSTGLDTCTVRERVPSTDGTSSLLSNGTALWLRALP